MVACRAEVGFGDNLCDAGAAAVPIVGRRHRDCEMNLYFCCYFVASHFPGSQLSKNTNTRARAASASARVSNQSGGKLYILRTPYLAACICWVLGVWDELIAWDRSAWKANSADFFSLKCAASYGISPQALFVSVDN
jgi:hypothetical protein